MLVIKNVCIPQDTYLNFQPKNQGEKHIFVRIAREFDGNSLVQRILYLFPEISDHVRTNGQYWKAVFGDGIQLNVEKVDLVFEDVILNTELRGRGLGSFLLNTVITAAKQWPTAEIKQMTWSREDEGNFERRKKFYDNFNIDFHPVNEVNTISHRSCSSLKCMDLKILDQEYFVGRGIEIINDLERYVYRKEYQKFEILKKIREPSSYW